MSAHNITNLVGNAGEVLRKNLKEVFLSGLYFDLTIVCGETGFKVHKIILHTQSDYFKSPLGGKFREATQDRIPFDEDPEIFHALLFFLYNLAWCSSINEPTQVVALYHLADQYLVPPLRQLAASRFKMACDPKNNTETFVEAIDAVLESTAPNDNTLWDILFPMVKENMALLTGHASFKELLRKHEDLNLCLLNEMSLGEESSKGYVGYGRIDQTPPADDDGSGGGYAATLVASSVAAAAAGLLGKARGIETREA